MIPQDRTFIIAEAGVNHNGSVEIAQRLIEAARQAGADCIKFQSFETDKLVSRSAAKAQYQQRNTEDASTQYQMLKRLELSEEDHRILLARCRQHGILFLSSPFDEGSADLLEELGVPAYKIPSGELTNHGFLQYLARKGKPLILSTGMATLAEVAEAVEVMVGTGNSQLYLLHCVTEYPAPFAEINLKAMDTLATAFGFPVGYSDHTPGTEIALAAVARGARIIEKHLTLDRNLPGPDHRSSLEPQELGAMVRAIRNVEQALGTGIKAPAPCEIKNMAVARKSLVATRDIPRARASAARMWPSDGRDTVFSPGSRKGHGTSGHCGHKGRQRRDLGQFEVTPRRICVVTTSRADYGLLRGLMRAIREDEALALQVIATGMHLCPEFGLTGQDIERDGFRIDRKIEMLLSADSDPATTKSIGVGLLGFADALTELHPDLLVLLGDRFELLAPAIAALLARIPIAHIHGGETSQGAVDEGVRHAVTKLASLHFASTETYRHRIIQMGEDPERVFAFGAPGLDALYEVTLLTKPELAARLDFDLAAPTALVTYHPVTLERNTAEQQIENLLIALQQERVQAVFTQANADVQGRWINQRIAAFCKNHPSDSRLYDNLGQRVYLSCLRHLDLMIGNSSSGLDRGSLV